MLHGETESIHIEPPGVDKAEFIVATGSRRELHQAKRSHPSGKWSLAALIGAGIVQSIGEQLASNGDRFILVSGSDARELADLCEAARSAASTSEFVNRFLAASERKNRFDRLCCEWDCDVPTAFERLRRIEVRTIGERDLQQKVKWGVQALFLADPEKVVAALITLVDESVYRLISRQDLIAQLGEEGYRLRCIATPQRANVAIDTVTNDLYLAAVRRKLIHGNLIRRKAARTYLSRLDDTPTESVITGRAGCGKTVCVIEIVENLRTKRIPVLALRLDRFLSASSTADLGSELRLEESPVLVLAAAAEAAGSAAVLIIDQLDAVSTMSGRGSAAFDLVEALLHEARGMRARAMIHTVVVCREFDWQHDPRLRRLLPKSHANIAVTEFSRDEVATILANARFDATLFRPRQLKILQLPQNLSLFLEAAIDPTHAPTFQTATELSSRYWDERRRSVAQRVAHSSDQWMDVIEALCDEMTLRQQLSVPKERLDRVAQVYLEQLASEGVVSFDGRSYGFGHESFFDYCSARVFYNRDQSLVSFLKGSEQHLFRRAQVRQVLVYLRDADFDRYVRELDELLLDDEIRIHMKDLALRLLSEVVDPTDEEWEIWQKLIASAIQEIKDGSAAHDTLAALARRRLFYAPNWFPVVDRLGLIADWLSSRNEGINNMVVDYLRFHQRHSPDRIAALLAQYSECGCKWEKRLRWLIAWTDLDTSRPLFDLFLRLMDKGAFDETSIADMMEHGLWGPLHRLNEHRPEWAPELLSRWLRRRLMVMRANGESLRRRDLFGYDGPASNMLSQCADRAPKQLVEHVLPVVLNISDNTETDTTPPRRDAVWPILFKTDHPTGEDACLFALATALGSLSRDAADLSGVIDSLRRETYVANYLLLALYRAGGPRYANEAMSLLCDEPWRLHCGFSDSPYWCAIELIREVVPHCTIANRNRVESLILGYTSQYERTREGIKWAGHARLALLSAFPAGLRSARADRHFKELSRKFGEPKVDPEGVTGGWVPSPIEKSAAEKMTDAQWLAAIAKYDQDRTDYSSDRVKGGAPVLARVLGDRAQDEPARFGRLSLRFSTQTNPVYLEHVLSALKGAAVATDLKLQVCRKGFAEFSTHCGRPIADVLGDIRAPLTEDAVRMLHWLAVEHEDPVSEAWQKDAGRGQPYYNGDIYTNGLNTTRGRAAIAIHELIVGDVSYIDRFRPTLVRMIRDRSAAVLSCVAGILRAVAYRDPKLAISLFTRMNLSEERLLATDHVYSFMRDRLRDSFTQLRPTIERMLRSPVPSVCKAGARLATIASVIHESAADIGDQALGGEPAHRLGVAQVAAANISNPECGAWAKESLVTLFHDDAEEVRSEAASCFGHLGDQALDAFEDLIMAFCDSKAYEDDSFSLLHALEDSGSWLPGMVCLVCERFLVRFGNEARDISTRRSGDASTVEKLVFRTYQQHQNDEWTPRALTLIDRLCLEGITDNSRSFEEFER